MTKKLSLLAMTTVLCGLAAEANANLISATQLGVPGFPTRKVTVAESTSANGGPAPANGDVYIFQVTTDSDILSVDRVGIVQADGTTPLTAIYNNSFGDASNANPGSPALFGFTPSLAADTWVTTPPTTTSRLGPDLPGDGATTLFGDTVNNGPQVAFQFAQITVPEGTQGFFNFRISINSTVEPGVAFSESYSLPIGIPEPATVAMGGMGLIALVGMGIRRRKA